MAEAAQDRVHHLGVPDSVAVLLAVGAAARVEVRRGWLGGEDADVLRQAVVERAAQRRAVDLSREVEVRDLPAGVDAGVRAAAAVHRDGGVAG